MYEDGSRRTGSVWKGSFVAIGRPDEDIEGSARADGATGKVLIVRRDTPGEIHGRFVAQGLFHGIGPERRLCSQAHELVGMGEQQADGIADQVGRGDVAGDQQSANVVGDLRV